MVKRLRLTTVIACAILMIVMLLHYTNSSGNSIKSVVKNNNASYTSPSEWKNVRIGGGGYVTGIYLHPRRKNLVYIKTDIGGFFRWNPDQQSWEPLTDQFQLIDSNYYGGEALALDPNNPDIVYIAVGKYTADWWQDKGAIFKSTDCGMTWKKLSLELKMGGNENKRWAGERLAVDPFNSNTILFGSRQDGLWKSIDAGKTWQQVKALPGKLDPTIGITAVLFNPQTPKLLYVAIYGDGIYQSSDTGNTWQKFNNSPTHVNRMVIAKDGTLYITHNTGVSSYRQDNGWRNITPGQSLQVFNAIAIDPKNSQHLIVAFGETPKSKFYQTLDSGTTWVELKRSTHSTVPWWSSFMTANPWIAAIEFDPIVTNRVWLTDWYGIWQTSDINVIPSVWTNYQKDHEELVIFSLSSPPVGSLLVSGVADVDGFQHDNGLDHYPSKTLGPGTPGDVFQDTYSIAYGERYPLNMVRVGSNRQHDTHTGATSNDGGLTWREFGSWPAKLMPLRVAVSATNPSIFVVIVSGEQALRTDDGGQSWASVIGLPNGRIGPWYWGQPLTADPVNGDTFYYYESGQFYRSQDGGKSFQVVYSQLPNEHWYALKSMPGVQAEVWISLDSKGLYYSTNSGQTFTKVSSVRRAYLFAFGKPPSGSQVPALYLYGTVAGIGEGIFMSVDKGSTWQQISNAKQPIGNSPTVMEASKQEYGLVFIGTNGRGIYYRAMELL